MVQSVSGLPGGWYVVVDNDASWRITVKGNVTVGAAALEADDLRKLQVTIKKDTSYQKFTLSGSVATTKDSQKTRNIQLTLADFAVSGSN